MAQITLNPAAIKAVTDLSGRAAAAVWSTEPCRLRGDDQHNLESIHLLGMA
jgi:hypothetical protein